MGSYNQCSVNLSEDLAQIIKEIDINGDSEVLYRMQDYIFKLEAEKQIEIVANDKQYQALKNTLDDAVSTYSNKRFKVSYSTALQSLIQTNTKSSKGARGNLEQTIGSFDKENLGILGRELNKIDHYRLSDNINITTEKGAMLNNDILKEIAGTSTNNNLAKQYANAIKIVNADVDKKFNTLNIKTFEKKSFTGMQTHYDKALRTKGFDEWYDTLRNNANLDESPFIRNKEVSKRVYDKLIDNVVELDYRGIPMEYKESVQALVNNNEIVFKTIDNEISYINEYGKPLSAIDLLGNSLSYKSKKIGERMVLGSSPNKMLEYLYNYSKQEDLKLGKEPIKFSKIQTIYDEVMGRAKIDSEALAKAGSNIRKLVNTTLFGTTVINSPIGDKITRAFVDFSKDGGQGELLFNLNKAIPTGISQIGEVIFKGIDPKRKGGLTKEETIYLNDLGITANVITAKLNRIYDEIGDLGAGDKVSKFVDGITKYFSKVSALETMDNIQTASLHTKYSKEVFEALSLKDWNSVSKGDKMQFSRYGITPEDYNVLTKIVDNVEVSSVVNAKIFNPNYVKDLTNNDLFPIVNKALKEQEQLFATTGLDFTEMERQKVFDGARLKLETKLRTLYNGESHIILGKADSRRNFFTRGAVAGTGTGEALRFFMQAKTYPLLYIDNVIRNVYYSTSIEAGEKFAGLIAFITYSTIGGIIVEQVNEALNNKEFKEINTELIGKGVVRGGFGGLAGDMLSGTLGGVFDYTKKSGYENKANLYKGIINSFGGVALSKTTDIVEGINNLVSQNPDPDKFLKSIKANIPLNNLFYLKGLMNYSTMALSEALGGKGLRKERRRLRKEESLFGGNRELLFDPLY